MPKRTHIPPYIRDFEPERIIELGTKPIFPSTFEEKFSVNLPYTIPARAEFSFSYTFPSRPNEILLTDVHRFGEASTNSTDYDYYQLKFGRVIISILRGSYVYLFDGTQTKLFWWGTEGELSEGVLTQSEYASTPSSSTFFGYSPEQNHSHICHLNAFGKNIVLKGYTVEGNTLKVTFFNEETTPVVLDKFTTTEPKNTVDSLFNHNFGERGICAIGDKIMSFGDRFITVDGVAPQPWLDNRSNVYITNSNYNTLEYNLGASKTIMSPEHGFVDVDQGSMDSNIAYLVGSDRGERFNLGAAGSVKHNNADEYFAAFMIGYIANDPIRFVLYDSETEQWQVKNSTTFTNSDSDIFTSDKTNVYSRQLGKKPMDIKHFASTGNVHALVSCFTGNYEPKIIYSNTNMETWTTLFSVSDISSANPNITTPSISTIGVEYQIIDKSLVSKIIDENTMFSEFCSYISNPRRQFRVLIKTVDEGTTWTDVHQTNPEYTHAQTVANYISDDGQDIYSMILYSGAKYSDTYNVLFNYSNDGGTTWAYPTDGWKIIDSTSDSIQSFVQVHYFGFVSLASEQRFKHQSAIYHNKETNEILVAYPSFSGGVVGQPRLKLRISRDNGQTWVGPYSPAIEDFETDPDAVFGSTTGGGRITPSINDVPPNIFTANDLFAAFNFYYDESLENTPNSVSVHDWIFESTSYGYTSIPSEYEDSIIPKSCLHVTHTNESAKITRLKGYYV